MGWVRGVGAIILRTYAGGGGVNEKCTGAYKGGGGGSEIGDFTAYVLYGCPLIDLILYGSDKLDDKKNHNILMPTIKFVKDSQRFDENLL